MSFGMSDKQKAEAKIATGRAQIEMSQEGRAKAIPHKLSNKDRLKLSKAGTKKLLEGTMDANRADKKAGITRRDNKVR